MKIRRFTTLVVASVVGLTLTACGSSPSTSSATSGAQQGSRSATYVPLTLTAFKTSVARSVMGIKTVHINLTSDIMAVQGDFSYGPPFAMNMTGQATVQGQQVTYIERLLGSDLYMQAVGHTPPGKFLKIDLSTLPQTAGIFKMLHQLQTTGPQAFAAQFKAATKSVKYDGTETISGQQARHYTVVVDAVAAVKLVSGDAAALAYAHRVKTITEQVYLASDHRPIRISMAMLAPVGQMQMDFSNYGEPVHVTAPPASQVIPVPASALGAGSTAS